MRHAHGNLEHAAAGRALDDRIQHRNQRLPTLKREALLPDVTGVQKSFELLGVQQALEDAPLFLSGIIRAVSAGFHPIPKPATNLKILDVHVLRPHRAAVRVLQNLQNLAQCFLAATPRCTGVELMIQISLRELKVVQIQLRQLLLVESQRIKICDIVPQHSIGKQQVRQTSLTHRIHRRQLRDRLRPGNHRCDHAVAAASAIEPFPVRLKLRPQLEALEERTPRGIDTRRVDTPLLVVFLKHVSVFRMANLAARLLTFLSGETGGGTVPLRRFHGGQSRRANAVRQPESGIL